MPSEHAPSLRVRLAWGAAVPVAMAAALWVATTVVRDFQPDGPAVRQAAAVLVITGVLVAVTRLLPIPLHRAWSNAARGFIARIRSGPSDPELSDRDFSAFFRRFAGLTGAVLGLRLVTVFVVGPVALHLAVRLCEALGPPVRLPGFGATVAAAWVTLTLSTVFSWVLWAPTGRRQARGGRRTCWPKGPSPWAGWRSECGSSRGRRWRPRPGGGSCSC